MNKEDVEESEEQSSDSSGDNESDMCEDSDYNCSSDEKKNKQNKPLNQRYNTSIGSEPVNAIEWGEVKNSAVKMLTKSCYTTTSDANGQLFKCLVVTCGQTFRSRETLTDHIRSEHPFRKTFECTQPKCNRVFKSDGNLRNHIFIYHTELKCKEPGCEFSGTKVELKRHQFVHTVWDSSSGKKRRTPKGVETTCEWPGCGFKTSDKDLRKKTQYGS